MKTKTIILAVSNINDKSKKILNNKESKYDKIMRGLGVWTSFYRENPHRLAIEYFNMRWLKPFQQILMVLILKFTYAFIVASRGMGKSQVVAACICVKCTLYPKLKVCIAAGKREQSLNVLKKITEEFMPRSANLRNEILKYNVSPSEAYIMWKNGSIVKVVTARDSARSARAHWVVGDEVVQIPKKILDSVIRKFKAGQRNPDFYLKPEYKGYKKEPNTETYITSATYKHNYTWGKFKSFFKSMIKGESYLSLGFPYQLPVREGYYPAEQIREEMQEDDWDSIAWSMEMESMFFGSSENAFYAYDDMELARRIDTPIYPFPYYYLLGDSKLKFLMKTNGEIRILSMDIAAYGTKDKKNAKKYDATSFSIIQMLPIGNGQYLRNLVYLENMDGGHGDDQAVRCRQLFDDFYCDYIVMDTNGVGLTVYDSLVRELLDSDRNITYSPFSCKNDEKMAERCNDKNAPKIIYSIKASQQFNSDACVMLRDDIKRNKFRLLVDESEANEKLYKNKNYQKLSAEDQFLFLNPFINTTLLIYEMTNLSYEVVNSKIKVIEQSGMRKDRYSSCSYGNWICSEIERGMMSKKKDNSNASLFQFRKPKPYGSSKSSLFGNKR